MFLISLNLQNFRNFKEKSFDFSSDPASRRAGTTLIVGPNASGKTNILEAIFLLATGKSFKASKELEMIGNGEQVSSIQCSARRADRQVSENINLQVILTTGEVQGKKTAKKLFKVNGVGRRWRDFVGNLKCVLFRPEDIDLILGSPSERRNYLDLVLEQIDWQYRACSLTYKKGIRQRNKLLEKIREGEAQRAQLTFWNQLLIKNGSLITQKRAEFIEFVNFYLETDQTLYQDTKNLKIEYDKSVINELRLERYKEAELAAAATLVGPHRDNLKFIIQNLKLNNDRDLALFGSRGEQRMAVLALKLSELEFIYRKINSRPTLLLDDIFSELDREHRDQVVKIIPKQQTIITSTDLNMIDKRLRGKINTIVIK